jgi:hypothetical protein
VEKSVPKSLFSGGETTFLDALLFFRGMRGTIFAIVRFMRCCGGFLTVCVFFCMFLDLEKLMMMI